MEELLAHSIDVGWRILIHWLLVHRLPQGTALHLASVKIDAQSLHVIVGLAVGAHLATRVGHSCSAAHSTGHHRRIGAGLPLDAQVGRESERAEPVVGIEFRRGGSVHTQSFHIGQQLLVHALHVPVMRQMVIHHRHLSASDTCTDVAHAVVVAHRFVLVIGISLACLGGVPHYGVLVLGAGAHECTASAGGYHLVAIETEHAVPAEGAQSAAAETGAETLGSVLDDGDVVLVGHPHDAVYAVRHAVEGHGDDGFGDASGLAYAVEDSLFEEHGVHIPGVGFAIHKHGRCTLIGDGMA